VKIKREIKVNLELTYEEFIVIHDLIETVTGGEQQILDSNRTDSLDILKTFLENSQGVI